MSQGSGHVITRLFGRFHWDAPAWLFATATLYRRHRRRFWVATTTALAIVLLAIAGYIIWSLLPQPILTRVRISPPGVTQIANDGTLYPQPVTLYFKTHYPDPTEEGPRNAARLSLLGKEVSQYIKITPKIDGEWRWINENVLRFAPEEDWPAGQTYSLSFKPDLFAPGIELKEDAAKFQTPSMQARINDFEFYSNPKKASDQRIVATLRFSHAVDHASLKKHLTLSMRPSGDSIKTEPVSYDFTIKFDKHDHIAYVTSEQLTILQQENFMTLAVTEGLATTQGSSVTQHTITDKVRIPAADTFFRVKSMDAQIVRDEDGTPVQTLLLRLTDGVKINKTAEQLQAYALPTGEYWQLGEITREVISKSTPITLSANPTQHPYATLQSFRFRAPQNRQMIVILPPGLVSHGGFNMTVPYRNVMSVPDYPTEVNIVGDGGLLTLSGSHKIAIQTRGVPAVRAEIYRLRENQFIHLITQTRGDLENANFVGYHFDESNISSQYSRTLRLHPASPADAVYASLDLTDFMSAHGNKHGMFVINVYGWDPEDEAAITRRSRRFILVTDTGLIAKDNADKTHDLFVHSLASEQPVANATVKLLGINGLPVYVTQTDVSGHAYIPDASSFEHGRTPAVYVVRKGRDMSFLPFDRADRKLHFSRFDVGGLRYDNVPEKKQLRAVVFTDRGIYRPGDSGHLAIIIKRNDWGDIAGLPVEIALQGPQGKRLRRERKTVPEDGFLEMSFDFKRNTPTGTYQAAVYLLDGDERDRWLGSVAFSVEMFQPDTLRIDATIADTSSAGWYTAQNYDAQVTLENLFGMPAQDNQVTASYTLYPTRFSFSRYSDFMFTDPFRDTDDRLNRSITRQLPDARTDAHGQSVFDIDLSQYGEGVYQLVFTAQGYETGGGRSVTTTQRIRVSPAKYLVGWKTSSHLEYLNQDSKHTVRFVAINPQLKKIALPNLSLNIIQRRHFSTLVEQDNGTLAYQVITKRVPVGTKPFPIAGTGRTWHIPTQTPGDYIAEIVGEHGHVFARVQYTVAGEHNLTGSTTRDAQLRIDLDQNSYKPGERIELQITAPYTGSGLITIERDRVYAYKWFSTDTRRSIQHIRLPKTLEGNAYINVTFVRSLDSQKIFTKPLSYAVASFAIDRSRRMVDIDLRAPEKVKPGETLPIHFQTSEPGHIVIYAVDEGILQVSGYDTPQPLNTFLAKRALTVGTSQIADLLMPEFKLLQDTISPGGDMAPAAPMLNRNLNPFARNVKAPVVYWSGIIKATGKPQTVQYEVPDYFNGQLTLMAVAVSSDAAGSTETHTLVHGPFVLQPSVITAAAPGDTFKVSTGITNALQQGSGKAKVTVRIDPDAHLTIVGADTRTLTLKPGEEGRATFRVRATSNVGASKLVFHAKSGNHSVDRTATLSIRPAVLHRLSLDAGFAGDGSIDIKLPRQLLPALAKQHATLGYSPLVLANGLRAWLRDYPYACTEQLVSGVFGLLPLLDAPVLAPDRATVMTRYHDLLATLKLRRRPDGGFTYWPGAGRSNRLLSIYVTHFLTVAQSIGAAVPDRMLDTALDYVRHIAAADPASTDPYLQAYAIYVLTRNGRVTTNYLTRLQEHLENAGDQSWRRTLAGAYMAASYKQLKLSDLADNIISQFDFERGGYYDGFAVSSPLARNAQYIYLLARHFPSRLADISDASIKRLADALQERRYNTLSASYTVLALAAWQDVAAQQRLADLRISTDEDDNEQTLAQGKHIALQVAVPLGTEHLNLAGDSDTRLFYAVTQSGYNANLPKKAVRNGLAIVREYLNDEGQPVTEAPQGTELTVRIRVRSRQDKYFDNVAIVALLPGGFEIQRDSLRGGNAPAADYVDIREDRVVLYTHVGPDATTFTYRVKATGEGTFVVPAIYAKALYAHGIEAHSKAEQFVVTGR